MSVVVRPEGARDAGAVRDVLVAAFAPSLDEARLVEALHASDAWLPELSLVAVEGDRVTGVVVLSRARLEESGVSVLALAPLAVAPEWQRRGVGSALMTEVLARAEETDFPLVSVLGDPRHYSRFGFEAAAPHHILSPFDAPPEAWQVLLLPAYSPEAARGRLVYAEAFSVL